MKFNDVYQIAEIEKNKKILRNFINGKGKTVFSGYTAKSEYRQVADFNKMVSLACDNILLNKKMPGINVPRIMCDFGTTSTAEYFGNKARVPEGCNKWIDPIINCISDIPKISLQSSDGLDVLKAYELWDAVSKKLETNYLSSSFIDIQGPLNTLALIWEQTDLLITMTDNPKKVHEVLEVVTDILIDIVKTTINKNMNVDCPLWPYIYLPTDIGVGITEDYMPLLSPAMYKEFGIPYLKRFASHFNGIFIHCCGQFTHQIDNLINSGINILGMEFVYPNVDIKKLFTAFGASAFFVPNIMDNYISEFGSITNFFKKINKLRNNETRLWYIINAWADDIDEQAAYLELISDVR